jgi:hypothetical protein
MMSAEPKALGVRVPEECVVLTSASEALQAALVGAFAPHVLARIDQLGIDRSTGLDGVIADGERWLADQLDDLLSTPYPAQRRGPLEVFQEAMRFPTEHLLGLGCEPVTRDPVVASALPGDVFDLAPASSAVLGETVWRAHLAWGAEKAATMSGRQG